MLFTYLFIYLFIYFIAVILDCAFSSGEVFGRKGLEMRWVGRVCGLWEKSANSKNSGKIRSERLRRFSVPDFVPASQNLCSPSESKTLCVDKLSLYSMVIMLLTVRVPCARKSPKSIFFFTFPNDIPL